MMKRSLSTFTLLLASVSAILGSGWLFTAYYAATSAGPSSLLAWILAGFSLMFVAFISAELNSMLPLMGASIRIPQMTHGTLTGFMYSWIIWLCYAAIPPTEVQAIIQYLSFYFPHLTHPDASLTETGYITAASLMFVICAINAYSIQWALRCNSALTVMKVAVPILMTGFIFYYYFNFHSAIHPQNSSFFPLGIKGTLGAISSGGMVYAFNGFSQACELGGAAKNPGRSLPLAIIGSIAITLFIYIALQSAFLTSLTPENLIHGWQKINLHRGNSPLAAILYQDGFDWMLPILFIGAIIGPFAAALIYANGAGQSLRGKSINGYLPHFLQKLSPQHTPVYAIAINFAFGMCLFLPLPGWNKMMAFLTSLMTFTYTIGPICLIALRDQAPNLKRPLRLPFGKAWATLAFYLCTVFSYFNGWEIISKLSLGFIAGFIIFILNRKFSKTTDKPALNLRSSLWIWPYIGGLTLISYLGTFGNGSGILPFGWDLLVIAIFTLSIISLAKHFKLPAEETQGYIKALSLPE